MRVQNCNTEVFITSLFENKLEFIFKGERYKIEVNEDEIILRFIRKVGVEKDDFGNEHATEIPTIIKEKGKIVYKNIALTVIHIKNLGNELQIQPTEFKDMKHLGDIENDFYFKSSLI